MREKDLEIIIDESSSAPPIGFRLKPDERELYLRLKHVHKVKNLPDLCKEAIVSVLNEVAKQVGDRAS